VTQPSFPEVDKYELGRTDERKERDRSIVLKIRRRCAMFKGEAPIAIAVRGELQELAREIEVGDVD
jgi:hypothetical protein